MHIYFSGIGGAGIGPLAQVAAQAGYMVSGSDKQDSSYIRYLKKHGIPNIVIDQSSDAIAKRHSELPIDWFVHTSALTLEHDNPPEITFCTEQGIKVTKRDELLNTLLTETGQKMIAIAGTHGKTTTTAMVVWLLEQCKTPASYLLPAKTSFADLGRFNEAAEYFVYEADEFDRNFLAFSPAISVITGVSWDHHEIFPEREDYQQAFRDFISQTNKTYMWQDDAEYISVVSGDGITIESPENPQLQHITLPGLYNRHDAWLAVQAVHQVTNRAITELIEVVNRFPGLSRRMEPLLPGLYSDYAHTPEKIRGAMSAALETAQETGKPLIVLYEPLTNRRQQYMQNDYKDCFTGAAQVYWLPSYLAREDPAARIIEPAELIARLSDPSIAQPAERDEALERTVQAHLDKGDMVVAMAGGGGDSLDDWLRQRFTSEAV